MKSYTEEDAERYLRYLKQIWRRVVCELFTTDGRLGNC